MQVIKKLSKRIISLTLASAIFMSSNIVVNANELDYQAVSEVLDAQEEVKQIENVEELDTTDTIIDTSLSVYKSRRLIIYSTDELEFKDSDNRDNIKAVQRLDDMYIAEYATVKDTEDAYNLYTTLGLEVEIDEVKALPEEIEARDNNDKVVKEKEIASTNTNDNKNEEKIDDINNDPESKTIVVAVLDTGLNKVDDAFNNRIVEGRDFVTNSTPVDNNGHGSAMAGIILDAATDENIKIMPIKVLNDNGEGSTLSAYKGIKYAIEKNVDVINLSLSGIGNSKLLENAINDATNKNIPVVVSAGNKDTEITEYTPANIDSAITISSADESIDDNKNTIYTRASYSNYGSASNNIDFATSGHFDYKRIINDKEITTQIDGTSVSAAYVTSFVAMLKSMALNDKEDLSFSDIYESLKQSAASVDETNTPYDNDTFFSFFGYGYLSKDNLVYTMSDREPTTHPVSDKTIQEDNITLNTTAGKYAVAIERGAKNVKMPDGTTKDFNNDIYVVYEWKSWERIGTYLGESKDATEAWNIALWHTVLNAHDHIAEFHIYSGMQINRDYLFDDLNWECYIRSEYDYDKQNIKVSGNSTKPLVRAKGVHYHSINIEDRRSGNRQAGLAETTEQLDIKDSILNTSNGTVTNAVQINNARSGHIEMIDATIDGCQRATIGIYACVGNGGIIQTSEIRSCKEKGVWNLKNNRNALLTLNNCDFHNNKYGIYNDGNCQIIGTDTRRIIYGNSQQGVVNAGTLIQNGGYINRNSNGGVKNTGSYTLQNGDITQNSNYGITNDKNLVMSGGNVGGNTGTGVINNDAFTMNGAGAAIYSNSSYGIENKGTVNHLAGGIYSNNGSKPVSSDSDYVGVYQNGTYNISGSANVYSNSIYLVSSSKYIDQGGKNFSGSALLTTALEDRGVIRELVKNSDSASTGKYAVSYGNNGSITHGAGVKNDNNTAFDGTQVGIRYGADIKKNNVSTTSQYLSGEYAVFYDINAPREARVNPALFFPTGFWYKEAVTATFGNNRPVDRSDNYEFLGWADIKDAKKAKYTSNQNWNNNSNVLSNNAHFYGIWRKTVKEKYDVHYIYNNGYDDSYDQTGLKRETYYNYIDAPKRYVSSVITFDPNGGSDITRLNNAEPLKSNVFKANKIFEGWAGANESINHHPGESFINLGQDKEVVVKYGNWKKIAITLPTCRNEDYALIGWQIDGDGYIYKPGDTYVPDDNPVNFVAIWQAVDRTVTYNPNGAVDANGDLLNLITVEKKPPLSSPFTLANGTDIGCTQINYDITYISSMIKSDLSSSISTNGKNNIQYKAKSNDILNNFNNPVVLAKFMGWSKEPVRSNYSKVFNGDVVITSDDLWGDGAYDMTDFEFYAVWDMFPVMTTRDITVNRSEFITREKLLEGINAIDPEDGNITDNIRIVNFDEIVAAKDNVNVISIMYEITDSAENTTRAFALLRINDDYDGKALPVITKLVRCINRHAYNTHDLNKGGCLLNSPWDNDPEYIEVMLRGFDNLDNNTPVMSFCLSQKERQDISKHMHDIGLEHMYEKEVLDYYVANYMDEAHKSKPVTYEDSKVFGISVPKRLMQKRDERELERLKELRNDMDLSRIYN